SATDRPDSDIDVFVVGGVNWNKIAELGQAVERDLGRPTNFVIWTEDEFERPSAAQVKFLMDILSRPRTFLVGGDADLERARHAVAIALAGGHPADGTGSGGSAGTARDRAPASRGGRATPTPRPPRRGATP